MINYICRVTFLSIAHYNLIIMKIRYAFQLAAFFLLMLILTASTDIINKNGVFSTSLELKPVLPDEPFDYDIDFPEHVIFGPWSSLDSSLINNMINPDGATLGRVLFYDKLLSQSNELACASCHLQEFAFADDRSRLSS